MRETVEVTRVPVGTILEEPAVVRRDGDTIIVPVMEEVAVVQKRLLLREEVRITVQRSESHQPQDVTLRREQVTVQRLPAAPKSGAASK